jgi:hypothetical protein
VRNVNLATSRYSNHELIIASGMRPIRTSIGFPRFKLKYELAGVIRALMPTRPMLKLPRPEYEALYLGKLDQVGIEELQRQFEELDPDGKGLVLLCFEDLTKPGEWCHRRMFATWFEERTGQAVPELVDEVWPAKASQSEELNLF